MKEQHFNFTKKKTIIDRYNSSFEYYDDRYRAIQIQKYGIALKNANFQSKLILDAGCGTGLLYSHLFRDLSELKSSRFYFVCLDISLNMLKEIKTKEEIKEKVTNVNLILADMENLPFREKIFDLIISITSLQNLPDISRGITELIDASKEDAEFYFSILKKDKRINKLLSKIKHCFNDFKLIDNEELEDLIILI